MIDLKPIQTRYAGYHFRSRLEARWAVFFDAMGYRWDYEPEGFQLPSGWYLPDFRVLLPPSSCTCEPRCGDAWEWFEIKGNDPTESEYCLAFELAMATGEQVNILFGSIPRPGDYGRVHVVRHNHDTGCPGELCPQNVKMLSVPEMAAALSARFEHGESGRT